MLFVEGVPENSSDYCLRVKCLGFRRDTYWNERTISLIARSESPRDIEAGGQHLASVLETELGRSSSIHNHTPRSSPPSLMGRAHNHEDGPSQTIFRLDQRYEDSGMDIIVDDSSSDTDGVPPTSTGCGIGQLGEETLSNDIHEPESMDSLKHAFLFCFAFALALLIRELFF